MFEQLTFVIESLTEKEYTMPSAQLSGATIGQHVRHIIELFNELNKGYQSGTVDYEKRARDYAIETDPLKAKEKLNEILFNLRKADKTLLLEFEYSVFNNARIIVTTNYLHEIIYNIEHTVHHMALIRIAIGEITSLVLPPGFGVATSTIKFRESLVKTNEGD